MGLNLKSKVTKRKDPLLPTTTGGDAAGTNQTKTTRRCGSCGHAILLLLPVLACALILVGLLLLTYRLDVPISEATISQCLARYDPKLEVLVPLASGATLSFLVTAMRNVQIGVYHRRRESESKCVRTTNLIAAIANVLAYAGFIVLAAFDAEGAGDVSRGLHLAGAFAFFVLTGVYGVLHAFLLFQQRQYPPYAKIIFALVPAAMIACSIVFGLDREGRIEFEWFSVALAALLIGLVSILFQADNVDDELRDFFCCRRHRGGKGGTGGAF